MGRVAFCLRGRNAYSPCVRKDRTIERKSFSLSSAKPCASSPRTMSRSPGWMLKILRAFAGITIYPLSPTVTCPKTCLPLGGTFSPVAAEP